MPVPGLSTRPDRQAPRSVASSATTTPSRAAALTFGAVATSTCARKRLGAASELRASVHLMEQGFDVYRCVAPFASFDLVASRDDELYRVEVKTISKPASRPSPMFSWPTNDNWDILILCADQAIFQFPFGVTRDEVQLAVARELGLEPVSRKLRTLFGLDPQPPIQEWMVRAMSTDPSAVWTGPAVLEVMLEQGWTTQNKNPRTLVVSQMSVLADRGLLERVSRGGYVLSASGDIR